MASTCFGSIKAKVIRVTRLDSCGIPVIGAKSTVVSSGFTKIDISPEYEDGEEYIVKNAWGDFCVNDIDDPRLKRVGATIEFCSVDPDIVDIVAGTRTVLSSTTGVGFALGEDTIDGRFALEAWTKVAGSGGCAGGSQQYVYWLLPNLGSGKMGSVTLENAAATFTMESMTKGAPNSTAWAANATPATTGEPYAQSYMPANEEVLVNEHLFTAITTVAPPTAACGAVALA